MRDFEEARAILNESPRGAAALLRLCLQKLCMALGEKGENLNEDVGNLVSKGLNKKIQKSLDIVRVIGNNAVHPGEIDLRDDRDTATQLLSLINLIAERMISEKSVLMRFMRHYPKANARRSPKRDNKSKDPA